MVRKKFHKNKKSGKRVPYMEPKKTGLQDWLQIYKKNRNMNSKNGQMGQMGQMGQAMVEFLIGILSIMVLFCFFLQMQRLSTIQTKVLIEARQAICEHTFANTLPITLIPNYIKDWEVGSDGSAMTVDDTFTIASSVPFQNMIVDYTVVDDSDSDWGIIDGSSNKSYILIHNSLNPVEEFGLLGLERSEMVEILPLVKELIYDAEYIDVKGTVWMPWFKGIY